MAPSRKPTQKLNATAEKARAYWQSVREGAVKPPAGPKKPRKPSKPSKPSKPAAAPRKLTATAEKARAYWQGVRASAAAKGKGKPREYSPRPLPGQATRQAYLDKINERAEASRKLTTARGKKLLAAKTAEILGFFQSNKPKSRRPAKTAEKLSRKMGLLRFFEISKNYSTAPKFASRSDFVVDKDKNGKQFVYWKKGNKLGKPPGERIAFSVMRAMIADYKDARGAEFVGRILNVSPADAKAIWEEMKAMPEFFQEHFGPEGKNAIKSPKVQRKS